MADPKRLPHPPHQIVAPNRFKVLLRPVPNPNPNPVPNPNPNPRNSNPTNHGNSPLRLSSLGNPIHNPAPNPNSPFRHSPAANHNPSSNLRFSSSSSARPPSISSARLTSVPVNEEEEEEEEEEDDDDDEEAGQAEDEEEEEEDDDEDGDAEEVDEGEERDAIDNREARDNDNDDDDDEDLDADEQKPVKKRRKLEEVAAMAEARPTFHSNTNPNHNTNTTNLSSSPLLFLHGCAPQQKKQNSSVLKETPNRELEQSGQGSNGHLGEALPSKLLVGIIDKLQKKDTYGVFAEPVDPNEVPGYYDFIKSPMDFGTMRKKISDGAYRSLETFQDDIYLICSNAMTYNAKDTIYFKQARGIQDAARKLLESLKGGLPLEGDMKSQQYMNLKRTPNRRIPPNSFDYSGGANMSTSLKGQHERYVMSSTNNLELQTRISNIAASSPGDSRFEFQDSVAAFRSVNGKRIQHNEDNHRSSYQPAETLFSALGPTLAAFGGEMQQLVPMGYQSQDFAYARSLARFSADLGPAIWRIAAEKIRKSLPPGVPFGPGWILEPPPGLLSPKSQSALMYHKMSTSRANLRPHSISNGTQQAPNERSSKNLSMHRSDANHVQSLGEPHHEKNSVQQVHNGTSNNSSTQNPNANHIVWSMNQPLQSVQSASKLMVESNPTMHKLPVTTNNTVQSSTESVSKSIVESGCQLPVSGESRSEDLTQSRFDNGFEKCNINPQQNHEKQRNIASGRSEDLKGMNGIIFQAPDTGLNLNSDEPTTIDHSSIPLPQHVLFPSGPLSDHNNGKFQMHQNNNVITQLNNFCLQSPAAKVDKATGEVAVNRAQPCLTSLDGSNKELKSRSWGPGHPMLQEPLLSHCLPPDLNVSLVSPSSHAQTSSSLTDDQNPDLALQL